MAATRTATTPPRRPRTPSALLRCCWSRLLLARRPASCRGAHTPPLASSTLGIGSASLTPLLQKLALGVAKQATFSHGIQRKSKRDLEREQAKRKQEEEERSVPLTIHLGFDPTQLAHRRNINPSVRLLASLPSLLPTLRARARPQAAAVDRAAASSAQAVSRPTPMLLVRRTEADLLLSLL